MKVSSKISSKGLLIVLLLVIFWVIAVVSRLLWNGDVYGLDFRTYHPDGVCYSKFAFDFAGESERGIKEINETYQRMGALLVGFPVQPMRLDSVAPALVLRPEFSTRCFLLLSLRFLGCLAC